LVDHDVSIPIGIACTTIPSEQTHRSFYSGLIIETVDDAFLDDRRAFCIECIGAGLEAVQFQIFTDLRILDITGIVCNTPFARLDKINAAIPPDQAGFECCTFLIVGIIEDAIPNDDLAFCPHRIQSAPEAFCLQFVADPIEVFKAESVVPRDAVNVVDIVNVAIPANQANIYRNAILIIETIDQTVRALIDECDQLAVSAKAEGSGFKAFCLQLCANLDILAICYEFAVQIGEIDIFFLLDHSSYSLNAVLIVVIDNYTVFSAMIAFPSAPKL